MSGDESDEEFNNLCAAACGGALPYKTVLCAPFPESNASLYEDWLRFPSQYVGERTSPCAVNAHAQCLQGHYDKTSTQLPSGPEFVFVWECSRIPAYIKNLLFSVAVINRSANLSSVIAVPGRMRLKKGNKNTHGGVMIQYRTKDSPATEFEIGLGCSNVSFLHKCRRELSSESGVFAQSPCISVHIGHVPISYVGCDGVEVRRVKTVLKLQTALGFDIHSALSSLQTQDAKGSDAAVVADAIRGLRDAVNMEAEVNLGKVVLNGSSYLPDPLDVSASRYNNIVGYTSPFLVLSKILRDIPTDIQLDTLVIGAFPLMDSVDRIESVLRNYDERNEAYLDAVHDYKNKFDIAIGNRAASKGDILVSAELPNILSDVDEWRNLDGVPVSCVTEIVLDGWLAQNTVLETASAIRLPVLLVACVTAFLTYSVRVPWAERERFINGFVGQQSKPLTDSERRKQKAMGVNIKDWPHDGFCVESRIMFNKVSESIDDMGKRTEFYSDYIHQCLVNARILTDAGQWLSACVEAVSAITGRLHDTQFIQDARVAFHVSVDEGIRQSVDHDEYAYAQLIDLLVFLSFNDKCMHMNNVNATAARSVSTACVHSYLGLCNNWSLIGAMCWHMGGQGHFKVEIGGHSVKVVSLDPRKRNTSGLSQKVNGFVKESVLSCQHYVPDVSADELDSIAILALDKSTGSALGSVCSLTSVNGVMFSGPNYKIFMKLVTMDEMRNLDNNALQTLTAYVNRDDFGGGSSLKACTPSNSVGGPHQKVETRLLRGCNLMFVSLAGNNHPQDANAAEATRSLAVVANKLCPGAPVSHGLKSNKENKRSRNSHVDGNSTGPSLLPSDKEEQAKFGIVFGIVPMLEGTLALMNKAGQIVINISPVIQVYIHWFENFIINNFADWMGKSMFSSFQRSVQSHIGSNIARALRVQLVASILRLDSLKQAMHSTLLNMELDALRLSQCNAMFVEILGKQLDMNVVVANGIFAHVLGTPALEFGFLVDLFSGKRLDRQSKSFLDLHAWLGRLVYIRQNYSSIPSARRNMLFGNYISVPDIKYRKYAVYLEKYLSMCSESTFQLMWGECTNAKIDLDAFVTVSKVSKVGDLFRVVALDYDNSWAAPPDGNEDVQSFVHISYDSKSSSKVPLIWVDLLQHLIFTSLQTDVSLHSDNIDTLARSLFQKIVQYHVPRQFAPPSLLVCNHFKSENSNVVVATAEFPHSQKRSDYLLRSKFDHRAHERGVEGVLVSPMLPYAIEDVVHLRLMQHSILHGGKFATYFQQLPFLPLVNQELVVGRVYPILDEERRGVICIAPDGFPFVRIHVDGDMWAVPMHKWGDFMREEHLTVAPLVFRRFAVVSHEGGLCLLEAKCNGWTVPHSDLRWYDGEKYDQSIFEVENRQYLDEDGNYTVMDSSGGQTMLSWEQVDKKLLSLGTHIVVKVGIVRELISVTQDLPGSVTHVRGFLRYPDECEDEPTDIAVICVAFKVRSDFKILCVPMEHCALFEGSGLKRGEYVDCLP